MTTIANVRKFDSSHWYYPDGRSCYELPKKSGPGMKVPNLTDARELGLLPSVTTILKVLNKPALNDWIIEQNILTALTTPRQEGESMDAFVKRVFQDEKLQDKEAAAAAERGSAIHEAIACAINSQPYDPEYIPYVRAAIVVVENLGRVVWSEKVVTGDGYAGRADLCTESDRDLVVMDWKSCKTLPKKDSWTEHKLQTSAYAKTLGNSADKHILTGNLYLSTSNPGETAFFLQENWLDTYEKGFKKLLDYWRWSNSYFPGGGQ